MTLNAEKTLNAMSQGTILAMQTRFYVIYWLANNLHVLLFSAFDIIIRNVYCCDARVEIVADIPRALHATA